MQRRSNINLNSAGKISSFLLLLITFLTLSPVASLATYAEEPSDAPSSNLPSATSDASTLSGTSTLSDSTIKLSFNPQSASNSVTPVDSKALPVYADVVATVTIDKSEAYWVYVGTDNANSLQNANNDTIESVTGNNAYSLSGDNAIPTNKWAYSFTEGSVADHDHYTEIPITLRGIAKDSGSAKEGITKQYALSFAANINSNQPSGTYSGSVTMSVVATPLVVTNDFGIATMQEMTNEVCNKAPNGAEAQLKDTRDGKYYWIGKLKSDTEGNYRCWMTQNLDLDLFDDVELKGDTTNLATKEATWKPTRSTTTDASKTYAGNTEQYSWSMGGPVIKPDATKANYGYTSSDKPTDYYTTNPNSTTSCGNNLTNMTGCSGSSVGGWTQMDVPLEAGKTDKDNAHRLLGNLYQWCAATAGCTNSSGQKEGSFTSGEAVASICPYGWKLPTSKTTGDFQKLTNALSATGGTSNIVKNLTDAPFYAVRGGHFFQNDNDRFSTVGSRGDYWSSTAYDSLGTYYLGFWDTDNIKPSNGNTRQAGFSVRCINNPDVHSTTQNTTQ